MSLTIEKPIRGGIKVEHTRRTDTWLYLIPILAKPTPLARGCNLCRQVHPCKTIHLHLFNGTAIVSAGVLSDLRLAGMPNLRIAGAVKKPPTIEVGGKRTREEQNQRNRRIVHYGQSHRAPSRA